MRSLGTSSYDPLDARNDYSDLNLGVSSSAARWTARGHAHSIFDHRSIGSNSMTHIRTNSFEAEDIANYDRALIGNSASSLIGGAGSNSTSGRSGLYYSPPGTSYTIVEREQRPHSPHYYYNSAGSKSRDLYLDSIPLKHNGQKKRPISPDQMLRMLNATSSSSSVPSSYHHSNGCRDHFNGRRSPASSPPSTTHQVYRRERQHTTARTVSMTQDGIHGFGICVKGGKETGVGVYISRIEERSVAEMAGLRPGDTILEVNGTPFSAVLHDEALKILKSSRQITMTVRTPTVQHGFDPQQSTSSSDIYKTSSLPGTLLSPPSRQSCSWMDRHGRPASPPYQYGGHRTEHRDRVRRVELIIEPGQSLGLMIRGGIEYGLGIFVTGVDEGSVAEREELRIGDQILEVNGQNFMNVTHDEAVNKFKLHKRMSLLVRDVGKVPHSCTTVEPEPWDVRKKCPVSAMVEEKARSLLPRHQFSNLSFYINEYGSRGTMTVEAFVSILLEILDTPDKHTLVTEIRELIFPEDRVRYDELVYRRSSRTGGSNVDSWNYDNHRVSINDLEVKEASKNCCTEARSAHISTGDEGKLCSTTDIKNRPPAPPYRSLSAGPILHPSSLSQNHISEKCKIRFSPSTASGNYKLGTRVSNDNISTTFSNSISDKSLQRLPTEDTETSLVDLQNPDNITHIVPDEHGNLLITVRKTKPILGIAMEGGANTKHPLPRIINIHEHGAAYETGGLEVGQLILEVDGNRVQEMPHQDVARLIAECYANQERSEIEFLVVGAKKSNLEPKPTALVFLEA